MSYIFEGHSDSLESIESILEIVDFVRICILIGYLLTWHNASTNSTNILLGRHSSLFLDLLHQLRYLRLVDRGAVNVVKSSIHLAGLDLHVFKDLLEVRHRVCNT